MGSVLMYNTSSTVLARIAVMENKLQFDVDRARETMLAEMNFMFSEGCRAGIQYPDEYKQPVNVFNEHSPTIYCTDKRKDMMEYIEKQVYNIGRK